MIDITLAPLLGPDLSTISDWIFRFGVFEGCGVVDKILVPQLLQKVIPAWTGAPHRGHTEESFEPQKPQKATPLGFSLPHLEHLIT